MYGTGISQEVGNGWQVCGDVEAVSFPVQNVYKMTYGDENATLEPVNGYVNSFSTEWVKSEFLISLMVC
jgi:hypothetical protein